MKNINFGQALEALKQGKIVAREGWNGKGMYLLLVKGEAVREAINSTYGDEEHPLPVLDAIYMKTAQGTLVPWLASQTDILSEDWLLVE